MNFSLKGLAMVGGIVALSSGVWCSPAIAASATGSAPTTVTVNNARDVPVVVYLERGPFDSRLGTVAPHSESILEMPPLVDAGDAVQFVVHPEGAQDLLSRFLEVKEGENVDLYVPNNNVGFLPPPPPEVIPNPGPGTTTLTVENPRDKDVVVFIERGEFDTRIGTVPANGKDTFYLNRLITPQDHEIQIFVHPEMGTDLESRDFQLTPEAHLYLKVPMN